MQHVYANWLSYRFYILAQALQSTMSPENMKIFWCLWSHEMQQAVAHAWFHKHLHCIHLFKEIFWFINIYITACNTLCLNVSLIVMCIDERTVKLLRNRYMHTCIHSSGWRHLFCLREREPTYKAIVVLTFVLFTIYNKLLTLKSFKEIMKPFYTFIYPKKIC